MEDKILDEGIQFNVAATEENARKIINLKTAYYELAKKIRHAKFALYGLVAFFSFSMLVECVQYDFDPLITGINGSIIAILVASAVIAQKRPKIGFIIGTTLILLTTILTFFGEPIDIFKGLLWKCIIIYYLIVGISAYNEYASTKNQLLNLGVEVND